MKLLLTSGGVRNESINDALIGLLGQPIEECVALCVPTAAYAFANGAEMAWRIVTGQARTPLCELGWKSLGVLELSALASVERAIWKPSVDAADVLLVSGGDPTFLAHWMLESGLMEVVADRPDLVYVGVSAGSLVMAPHIGQDFVSWPAPGADDRTLGLVDFAMFPHVDHPDLPENTMADAERWAASMDIPAYAMDDDTAFEVVEGRVRVVSEGRWRLLNR